MQFFEDMNYFLSLVSEDCDIIEKFDNNQITISVTKDSKRWIISNLAEIFSVMGMFVRFNEQNLAISGEV